MKYDNINDILTDYLLAPATDISDVAHSFVTRAIYIMMLYYLRKIICIFTIKVLPSFLIRSLLIITSTFYLHHERFTTFIIKYKCACNLDWVAFNLIS